MIIYRRPPYPDIYYPYLVLSVTDKSVERYVRSLESIVRRYGIPLNELLRYLGDFL